MERKNYDDLVALLGQVGGYSAQILGVTSAAGCIFREEFKTAGIFLAASAMGKIASDISGAYLKRKYGSKLGPY